MLCPICKGFATLRIQKVIPTLQHNVERLLPVYAKISEGTAHFRVIVNSELFGILGGSSHHHFAYWEPKHDEVFVKHFYNEHEYDWKREVGLLSLLDHPNMVKLIGAGSPKFSKECMQMFSVSEWVPETLEQLCIRKKLRWTHVITYLRDVMDAINTLHHIKWVHMRLRLKNIGIANHNKPEQRAVLLNFSNAYPLTDFFEWYIPDVEYIDPALRPLPNTQIDIRDFGILFLKLALSVFGGAPYIPEVTDEHVDRLKPHFPPHLKELIQHCLREKENERPPAETVLAHLNEEKASMDIPTKYKKSISFISKWLKSYLLPSADTEFYKYGLTEFAKLLHRKCLEVHKEWIRRYGPSNTLIAALEFKATQEIEEFCMIVDAMIKKEFRNNVSSDIPDYEKLVEEIEKLEEMKWYTRNPTYFARKTLQ